MAEYSNILNLKGIPNYKEDRSVFMFSDQGAWHGYALPPDDVDTLRGSFIGPYILTQDNGVWLSKALSMLQVINIKNRNHPLPEKGNIIKNVYLPNKLRQVIRFTDPDIVVDTELIFISGRTSIIKANVLNPSNSQDLKLSINWTGKIDFIPEAIFSKNENGIEIRFSDNKNIGFIGIDHSLAEISVSDTTYTIAYEDCILSPGKESSFIISHTFCFGKEEMKKEASIIQYAYQNIDSTYHCNNKRWKNSIELINGQLHEAFRSDDHKKVAIKCLNTLNNNHRSAAGALKHDGLFPSYNYKWFNGFWAWDSWKHAVGIAIYDPELAQDQIRAMYNFQDSMGMIADCVYRDNILEANNWRDTKPPLSAWAIWKIFEKSANQDFLKEMFPKIENYHSWWYRYRDHDKDGLCEYGSTDGSLIAAKWESGMDNAVRFDDARILKNNEHSWSMNRESVDLNAYLYAEKEYLTKICEVLGYHNKASKYSSDAQVLKTRIQTEFWDDELGWFFDIELDTGKKLRDIGSEGWIPLWAGAASRLQAKKALSMLTDTTKFSTYIPFPTLAADHPGFKPRGGYWRGPIWLDQVYFAIKGLLNYGYVEEARQTSERVINRLEGLKNSDGPIWENYHPLTGEGMESRHFSWSAAHILMLLSEDY